MSDFVRSEKVKGKANRIVVSSRKYQRFIITRGEKLSILVTYHENGFDNDTFSNKRAVFIMPAVVVLECSDNKTNN